MKLRIVSDLHFEFHPDQGEEMTKRVTIGDYDVLVVAGDLAPERVVCNPYGYHWQQSATEPNPDFDPEFTAEV